MIFSKVALQEMAPKIYGRYRNAQWAYIKPNHTLLLHFLFSDWLVSKYAECIENV